jgi:hypothetical protein
VVSLIRKKTSWGMRELHLDEDVARVQLGLGDLGLAALERLGLLGGDHDPSHALVEALDLHLAEQRLPDVVLLVRRHAQDEPVHALAVRGEVGGGVEAFFVTWGPGLGRGGHGFDRGRLGFSRKGYGFDHRDLGLDRGDLGFDHRDLGFDHRDLGFDRGGLGFDHRDLGFDHRDLGFDHRDLGFDRGGLGGGRVVRGGRFPARGPGARLGAQLCAGFGQRCVGHAGLLGVFDR